MYSFLMKFWWKKEPFIFTSQDYPVLFFSHSLGNNPKAQKSNLARECIRNFFPERKCFVFDRPTNNRDDLLKLENLSEDQLDPQFQKQTHDFCSYVFTNAKVKTLKEGIVVTGNRESYLHIFGCTNICCIDYKMSINYFYLIIITMVYIY